MYRPRIIPCLLLHKEGLVKTIHFENPNYLGDPINAVKIFNDCKSDELLVLDILASSSQSEIKIELLEKISEEAYMPFAYGGGLTTLDQIRSVFDAGAEKIVLNSILYDTPELIKQVAQVYGSQAIIASIDVRKDVDDKTNYVLYSHGGSKKQAISLSEHVLRVQNLGAGEIMINSIDKDGTMDGYDLDVISQVSLLTNIPVIACGGAGKLEDMRDVINKTKASAAAAGSLFVYIGSKKAVMINYPDQDELLELFD